MKIEIELPTDTVEKLEQESRRLRIPLGQLASIAVEEFVSGSDDDFRKAAEYVLTKNDDLLRRLS